MQKSKSLAVHKNGEEHKALYQENDTNSPLLPVDQMERFHHFLPDANNFILEQTRIEAEHRRKLEITMSQASISCFKAGQIFGFLIGVSGVIAGTVCAYIGAPGAGGTIASIAIGTLAVAFLRARKNGIQD